MPHAEAPVVWKVSDQTLFGEQRPGIGPDLCGTFNQKNFPHIRKRCALCSFFDAPAKKDDFCRILIRKIFRIFANAVHFAAFSMHQQRRALQNFE